MAGGRDVFNVEVFFIVFRESLEAIIVCSVLLAFLKRSFDQPGADRKVYKSLRKQVWLGMFLGVFVCLVIGGAFIGTFYTLGRDIWSSSEDLWEGIFCLLATIIISLMGIPMLRIPKMQEKWRIKLAKALVAKPKAKSFLNLGHYSKKYVMFILPFITCLREGLEAVVFVGGVGLVQTGSNRATGFPLPVFCGLIAGIAVGLLLFYFGASSSMQFFLIFSTGILYLISAGLFSRAAWYFDNYQFNTATGGDASESGAGPGSYDITKTVYHVNCCNPEIDNGWDIFNAILGWQNTGYYSSVICYNIYWIVIISILGLMLFEEKRGHLPFCKNLKMRDLNPMFHLKKGKKEQAEMTQAEVDELFKKAEKVRYNDKGERIFDDDEEIAEKSPAAVSAAPAAAH